MSAGNWTLTRMPKKAVHERYGHARDVLRVVDAPAEMPAAGEVVVRMEAAAMHIADLRTIAGALQADNQSHAAQRVLLLPFHAADVSQMRAFGMSRNRDAGEGRQAQATYDRDAVRTVESIHRNSFRQVECAKKV